MQEIIPTSETRFLEVVEDVKGQIGKNSQITYGKDAKVFAAWLRERGILPLAISRSNMIAYRAWLFDGRYAKATANRLFSVARRILEEYHQQKEIPFNPAQGIKGEKGEDETTHTALNKQQAIDFLKIVDRTTKKGKRDYALLILLIKTGIRRAECAGLTIGDIAMERGHHIAYVRHGKGNERRIVKLRTEVYRALQEYLTACQHFGPLDAPLFIGFHKGDEPTGKGISTKLIEHLVKEYGKRIDVQTLTPHGLRASFITLAMEGGATLVQTQYAAGHKDPRTTERYQKRKLNLDNNAVDKLDF